MDVSGLEEVERQRYELENNISKLRNSLRHWQSWEIEYEGLREEIAGLPDGSNTDDILAAARDFRADLVDEKELQTIVGGQGRSSRNRAQIVDLLEKRVGYVSCNVRTIEKQLSDAQRKRNALLLAKEPDYCEDAGLPLTDITEELDDEGNLVSSRVETPASTAPQLIEVLKKAGVRDVLDQDGVVTASKDGSNGSTGRDNQLSEQDDKVLEIREAGRGIGKVNLCERSVNAIPCDSSVGQKISDEREQAKEGDGAASASHDSATAMNENREASNTTQPPSAAPARGLNETGKPGEDVVTAVHPDDSPEDAALRREMLAYGFGEMGAIVAELEMEEDENSTSFDGDETTLSFDSDVDDDEVNSEDESGMEKHPAMSREYLEKMKGLEEKYSLQNAGPDANTLPTEIQESLSDPPAAMAAVSKPTLSPKAAKAGKDGAVRPATRQPVENSPKHNEDEKREKKKKKRVAFAEDLDVASESSSSSKARTRPEGLKLDNQAVKDSVVERQTATANTTKDETAKPSRFKQGRAEALQTRLFSHHPASTRNPDPNPSQIQTPTIVERATPTAPPKPPQINALYNHDNDDSDPDPDPDHIDPTLHRQEIAAEYYKLRNRAIQRQDGGFVGGGEAENYGDEIRYLPVAAAAAVDDDDDNGEMESGTRPGRKVSRFMAARVK